MPNSGSSYAIALVLQRLCCIQFERSLNDCCDRHSRSSAISRSSLTLIFISRYRSWYNIPPSRLIPRNLKRKNCDVYLVYTKFSFIKYFVDILTIMSSRIRKQKKSIDFRRCRNELLRAFSSFYSMFIPSYSNCACWRLSTYIASL